MILFYDRVYKQISDVYVSGKNSITYENNDLCKQRLVLTLHIERIFGLKVFFYVFTTTLKSSRSLSPIHYQPSRDTNSCNFLFVSTFVGDFGRELSCQCAARLNTRGVNLARQILLQLKSLGLMRMVIIKQ